MAAPLPKTSIRDVAARAGVSVAAVSRFVNQKQRFTPEVEARIERAVQATGYRSHPAARSMATGRSGAVAALVAGADNPHAAALVKGLCRVAMAEHYDVLFVDTLHSIEPLRELERVMAMQVDGLVIAAPLPLGTDALLARYGRPFIDLVRRANPEAEADHDAGRPQQAAGALLARYLLRTGHRHISFVACALEATSPERLFGLTQVLASAGLLPHIHHAATPDADGGAAVASSVFLAAQRPHAVVACNDQVAMGLLSQARVLGVEVPAEASVLGIGNSPFARYLSPALTSVDLHADEQGAQAMSQLLAAVRGLPAVLAVALPEPQLVVRASVASRLL